MMRSFLAAFLLLACSMPVRAASRYLADNTGGPVKWEAWGPKALERAKTEKRPIFLSIAYAGSFDAYRMQRGALLVGEIAESINAYFVPVLLDRLEHPEIAESFETIARSMGIEPGWPIVMILTPSLEPFRVTGYMDATFMNRMLVLDANRWANENEAVVAEARQNVEKAKTLGEKRAPGDIDPNLLDAVAANIAGAPAGKAPQPMMLSFQFRRKNEGAAATLRKWSATAVRDQLGGGWHRAATDAEWRAPQFEKMTSDQALMALAFLDAYQLSRDPAFAAEVRSTLDAAIRDLRQANGGFDAGQNAYNLIPAQGPEFANGVFYMWNKAEIVELVGGETAAKLFQLFGIAGDERNVLHLADPGLRENEQVKAALAKLLEIRQKRPQPFREKTVYAGINGLMMSALARSGAVLAEKTYIDAAEHAARLVSRLWNPQKKTLYRSDAAGSPEQEAIAEDYALLIQGLIDVFEASTDPKWLELAMTLQKRQDELFWNESLGRYATGTTVPENLRGLLVERDADMPSANSVSAMNLLRLATLTGDAAWRGRPTMIFQSFGTRLRNNGAELPQLASALAASYGTPKIAIAIGDTRSTQTQELINAVHARREDLRVFVFIPSKLIAREKISQLLPFTRALAADPEKPIEYECSGGQCRRR